MKIIAINGSPRKHYNTATLLQNALQGAISKGSEAELFHLYDIKFKGCTSCFACKRKGNKIAGGVCAMQDELTPILEKIVSADALLIGSPIYLGDVTGAVRSFIERLIFPSISYELNSVSPFKGKLNSGFIYTMGVSRETLDKVNYSSIFSANAKLLTLLNGISEFLYAPDMYQFDDYSEYDASVFNELHKRAVREKQFPIDLKNAYELGAKLAGLSYSQNNN